jgi:hypothetical protein
MNGLGVQAKNAMLAKCEPNHIGKSTAVKQQDEYKRNILLMSAKR